MAYGDGSIREVSRPGGGSYTPKKWRVSVYGGRDPITGKAVQSSRIVNGSMADARRARDALRAELESGVKTCAANVTFAEFAWEWYESRLASGALKGGYATDVRGIVRCFGEAAGRTKLRDFDARAVESMYKAVRDAKKEAGHPLGNTRMRKYHQIANQIFERAESYGLIARNPASLVEAPKIDEVNRDSLSAGDIGRLIATIDAQEAQELNRLNDKEQRRAERGEPRPRSCVRGLSCVSRLMAVRIGLATGARIGEILALTWGQVDGARRSVRITRSVTPRNVVKTPKSRAGIRSISIDESTAEHLEKWRAIQADALESIGARQTNDTPVCCSDTGTIYRIPNFENWWRGWREENGFPGRKFHELRHTQATMLLANRVDVKTVQTRLGHANASLTLNQYAHAIPEKDRECADVMGFLLSKKDGEKSHDGPALRLVKTA